jgi:hypothetical protein
MNMFGRDLIRSMGEVCEIAAGKRTAARVHLVGVPDAPKHLKKPASRLTKRLLETAEGMRRTGILNEKAHEKIKRRHQKEKGRGGKDTTSRT